MTALRRGLRHLMTTLGALCLCAFAPDTAETAWTACMTAATPARAAVRMCAMALRIRPMSRFHRSLLLSSLGDAHARLRQYGAAVEDYSASLAATPMDDDALASRGRALEAMGELPAAERDYTAAIAAYAAAPGDRDNGSADVIAGYHALRGRVRLQLGRPGGALSDLDKALKIDPSGATAELMVIRREAVTKLRTAGSSQRRPGV